MSTATVAPVTATFRQVLKYIIRKASGVAVGEAKTVANGKFCDDSSIISYEANVGVLDNERMSTDRILELKLSDGSYGSTLEFKTEDADLISAEFRSSSCPTASVQLDDIEGRDLDRSIPREIDDWDSDSGAGTLKPGDELRLSRSLFALSKLVHGS